jgi:hypothetical protein
MGAKEKGIYTFNFLYRQKEPSRITKSVKRWSTKKERRGRGGWKHSLDRMTRAGRGTLFANNKRQDERRRERRREDERETL